MSSMPIHMMPPLSSVDAPAPLPPYTEQHFDQQDLPRLVVEKESAPANDHVKSSVSPNQVDPQVDLEVPRGSPISEDRGDPPPLPAKPKELLNGEGDLPSQSGEVSPFADPKSEPPPNLRPGFVNVRRTLDSSSGSSQGRKSGALSTLLFESPVSMAPASNTRSIEKERKDSTRSMNSSNEGAYDAFL